MSLSFTGDTSTFRELPKRGNDSDRHTSLEVRLKVQTTAADELEPTVNFVCPPFQTKFLRTFFLCGSWLLHPLDNFRVES